MQDPQFAEKIKALQRLNARNQRLTINNAMPKSTDEARTFFVEHLGLSKEDPKRAGTLVRNWLAHKKYRFGLTPSQIEELLTLQQGRCAICDAPSARAIGKKGSKGFHFDHDHKTRLLRGLLCDKCNRGLGFFNHSLTHLQRALRYLANPPASQMKPTPEIRLEQRGSKLYDANGVQRVRRT
jgi:hypothetical protein